MKLTSSPAPGRTALRSLPALFTLLVALGAQAFGQSAATDASTPSGLKPGSPAGSYQLTGFDNVNPYSGSLSFQLPLLKVGGRGSAGYTMTLAVEQKWLVQHLQYLPNSGMNQTHQYFPDPNWWGQFRVGLGPGVMQARGRGIYSRRVLQVVSFLVGA